ncbi:sigma-70 family RNA polymerase sigma factor [Virgibacillus kekensis]|uniref:Sigma-70 family RNA polymerase sigma factor n=1 Tax=Virgibacillus kekensis TaxID=202261 RepID=A0ABV9DGV1_9BACI
MKNGPVYSNISIINRAFGTFGSPLHKDLIIDYVRTHWENGRGTSFEDAYNIVKYPLEAEFYYRKTEEQDHFSRKQALSEKLDELYSQLRMNPNPWIFSTKTVPVKLNEIYRDPRFDIVSSDGGKQYLILTEWNLLNDLVLRFMVKNGIKQTSIAEIFRDVIIKYEIDDREAYFFPKIDARFKVGRGNIVSLVTHEITEDYSVHVTEYIMENVAIQIPMIKNYLLDNGTTKIRTIIQDVFAIQPHFPLFTTYFEAIKKSLSVMKNVFLINSDSLLISEANSENAPQTIQVGGNKTDFQAINEIVAPLTNGTGESNSETLLVEPAETREVKVRENLSYTLRYFDRIQESLTGHYFKDWIIDDHMKVIFATNENEKIPYIFHYDEKQNILYGEHLSNFMIDYDLEPGQKLEFNLINNKVFMKLGSFNEAAHTEQMKYEDIARLSEVKHYGTKSLLQNLAELLMSHPSGLHIRQIVLDIKGETSYTENTIRSTLSSYPFFETIPGKVGYWRFNPRQWKRAYIDLPEKPKNHQKNKDTVKVKGNPIPSLASIFKRNAYATRKTKRRLTNRQYTLLPKEEFIEMAWEYYSFIIYQYAKNNKSNSIPLEDLYQEAYFALLKAYEKYNPEVGNSFYHYFKRRLSAHIHRYVIDNKGLIRIPVHRAEELAKVDKEITIDLLLTGNVDVEESLLDDYTLYKTNYLSFDELYLYHSNKAINSELKGRSYFFFDNPIFLGEYDTEEKVSTNYFSVEEPEKCDLLIDDIGFENIVLNNIIAKQSLEYLKDNVRNSRDYEVILYRNGFVTGEEMTLEEVGTILGVTRERIRQIEKKGIELLKSYRAIKGGICIEYKFPLLDYTSKKAKFSC